MNLSILPLIALALAPPAAIRPLPETAATIRISADRAKVGMGRTVVVTAIVRDARGRLVRGTTLQPTVNGRRWGSEERTDGAGRAEFLLPLPNPGTATIRVQQKPPIPDVSWIWADDTRDNQTVWFRKSFVVQKTDGLSATLNVTADDSYDVFLNGHELGQGSDFHKARFMAGPDLERWLVKGTNVLAVECRNGTGPAGLLAELVLLRAVPESPVPHRSRPVRSARGGIVETFIVGRKIVRQMRTDASWEVYTDRPDGWPAPSASGSRAHVVAPLGKGAWGEGIEGWLGLAPSEPFPVGLPTGKVVTASGRSFAVVPGGPFGGFVELASNPLRVHVFRRPIRALAHDPGHLVAMEWEPWFTPKNIMWQTAESQPVIGYYNSYNEDVARQHGIWMVEAGVDLLLVDWTNNLWDKKHWSEHGEYVDELVQGTQTMLDVYVKMRREGIPVPRVALLLGLENGPRTTVQALNEEMAFVYDRWIRNPKYRDIFQTYEGKPLMIPFGGFDYRNSQPPIDEGQFTIRWMSSQLQSCHLEKKGYWSWMDGSLHPIPTFHNGKCEAITVTPSFFADGGWTYPPAYGRLNGWTYLESFRTAFPLKPRFLIVNQWNEFAGQPDGGGYGPKKDQFVDCYTTELSDDIEPTSLHAVAYRPGGGWGYYYLNLTRALVAIYRGQAPETTLLAIKTPLDGATVAGPDLEFEWTTVGRSADRVELLIDGKVRVKSLSGRAARISLKGLPQGTHTLTLRAVGASSRFPLSRIREDEPTGRLVPTTATCTFFAARPSARQGQFDKSEGTR